MLRDFREFLARGNIIELAVAVVIGVAFNQIVNSLVEDIIAPLIGIGLGRVDFASLVIQVGGAEIRYGEFIQAIISFLITAFALFLIVQIYNRFKRREEQKEEIKKETQPSQEVVLLTQIRDVLTDRRQAAQARQAQPPPPPRQ